MTTYDVTLTIREKMPVYPGEPGPRLEPLKRMSEGEQANVSKVSMGLHTGTHVDAPWHFVKDGARVHELPLEALCGPARLLHIGDQRAVTVQALEEAGLEGVERVLFRTRNSELWEKNSFQEDYVYIEPAAARWLVEHGVKLVGVDYLSAEDFDADGPCAHKELLGAGIVIIEGLDLRQPPPGDYELLCLPLKIEGGDGAPARVLLRQPAAGTQKAA